MDNLIVVGSVSDNPFVDDMVQHLHQQEDYSDLISLKSFLNSEFCPRFIVDENDWDHIGRKLKGKRILIVSSTMNLVSRNDLSMRNCLIARAAKDNGADRVILLEPDLFYSAQDRGPQPEHGVVDFKRDQTDYKKFDGQPFSARLYAELLKLSGVDEVITVHNHSSSVRNIFMDRFLGNFHNLKPADVYASYIRESDVVDDRNIVICAPDKGAIGFAKEVHEALNDPQIPFLAIDKKRIDEREVAVDVSYESPATLVDVKGRDVVVIDDMVRTGGTIVECCRLIKSANPNKTVFFVTHFYSSREGRINLNDDSINEIVTSNTIPQVLNKDVQGRLRYKMVVLKLERWISKYILTLLNMPHNHLTGPLYREDISSKNPRWKGKMGPLFAREPD